MGHAHQAWGLGAVLEVCRPQGPCLTHPCVPSAQHRVQGQILALLKVCDVPRAQEQGPEGIAQHPQGEAEDSKSHCTRIRQTASRSFWTLESVSIAYYASFPRGELWGNHSTLNI